eukprot:CAMPEP_0114161328 /NCGR_PEP_ID=MMETSP0043_2-20121206/28868_1 /TAXON_ID=464988 /ORGANISM="Hemiselmis andersenii, Strain CCMP644" /LENGTH=55 /DNA_ID=CAMNT_0001257499 /DNA_START=121 /DNA_END=288 /DNA_ORIENTATION=-
MDASEPQLEAGARGAELRGEEGGKIIMFFFAGPVTSPQAAFASHQSERVGAGMDV